MQIILLREKESEKKIEDLMKDKWQWIGQLVLHGFTPNTSEFSRIALRKLICKGKQKLEDKKLLNVLRLENQTMKVQTGFWGGVLKGARENMACD